MTAVGSAESTRNACMEAIFEAGIAGLAAEQQGTLRTIRKNRSWNLSPAYLTVDRSEADWVLLRDSLDARRIEADKGFPMTDLATQCLAVAEADASFSAAKVNADTNMATAMTAWNAAVSD